MIGEIKRHIRDDGPIKVSRSIKELGIKIRELEQIYLNKKGKEITVDEIEKELNVSKEDIILANTENVASCKVAKKCGFEQEGVLHSYDFLPTLSKREDVILYAKIKKD